MKSKIAIAVSCAVLTACGGGGGEPPVVALSAANYLAATREAISPASFLSESSSLILGVQVSGANTIFKFSRAQLAKISGWFSSASPQVSGVTQTDVYPCENTDGSMSVTEDDVNANGAADPGDSVTIVATNCLYEGAVLNGEMRMVIDSITGVVEVPPFAVTAGFTLNNFEVRYGSASERANGSFSLSANVPSYIQSAVSINAPSLAMSSTDGSTTRTRTLNGYVVSESLDAGTTTISVAGTVNTSVLQSNALTTTTVSPFTVYGDADPSVGQATINAALGGRIRVTALGTGEAFVELDANGDGTYETSISVPWSELI